MEGGMSRGMSVITEGIIRRRSDNSLDGLILDHDVMTVVLFNLPICHFWWGLLVEESPTV